MPSPFPIAPLFGSLLFLARHEPQNAERRSALIEAIRSALGGAPLRLDAEPEALRVNGEAIPLDAPGAAFVNEQLLVHGLRSVETTVAWEDRSLDRLAGVLAAFPGAYRSFAEVVDALGGSAAPFRLDRAPESYQMYHAMPWQPEAIFEEEEAVSIDLGALHRGQALPPPSAEPPAAAEIAASLPTGAGSARPPLGVLVQRGREAIEREDWSGLLDAALGLLEAETEAPSDLAGSSFRVELRRLVSRHHLGQIARLTHGERKQEAIALLRRFGADSTEVLMKLLADAMTLGERRGYFTAITQIRQGGESVIQHLGHPVWYVVRNAANLCGELELAEAVPELGRQVRHPDERVRKAVAAALARIATPTALEYLRRSLEDTAPGVRAFALTHMAGRRLGSLSEAVGRLLEQESDPAVQREGLLALGRIGTPEAVAVLHAWARSPKDRPRRPLPQRLLAVRALAAAGPVATDALAELSRIDEPEVRAAAEGALNAIEP